VGAHRRASNDHDEAAPRDVREAGGIMFYRIDVRVGRPAPRMNGAAVGASLA
jgi:hypothetical protein